MSGIKILYAAGNNYNSKISLQRFLKYINKNITLKIAAYKISSPKNIEIDWTLDCLLNMFKPEHISLENENFDIYFNQVRFFSPDLIISDLEYYTSCVANSLNIPLWQYSSSLLNYSLDTKQKYDLGIFKKYSYLMNKDTIKTQRIINVLDNSDRCFVVSHFGDASQDLKIKNKYEWSRPYSTIGKISKPCQHNIVAALSSNNKKIINLLNKQPDTVLFSGFTDETYDNVYLKNDGNQEEYYCNIKNSNLFLCEGQTNFLADAYYNGKSSIIYPDLTDLECVINSVVSEKLKLGYNIYDNKTNINYSANEIAPRYDENIKYLHEELLKC